MNSCQRVNKNTGIQSIYWKETLKSIILLKISNLNILLDIVIIICLIPETNAFYLKIWNMLQFQKKQQRS